MASLARPRSRVVAMCCNVICKQQVTPVPSRCLSLARCTSPAPALGKWFTGAARTVHDDGSLLPDPPASGPARSHSPNKSVPARVDHRDVPHRPPFALTVLDTSILRDDSELLTLFKANNPTEVQSFGPMAAVFFTSRQDLIDALARNGDSDIHCMTLRCSNYVQYMSRIGDKPPFQAYLARLPPDATENSLYKLFKGLEPTFCLKVRTRRGGPLIAFMNFKERDQMLVALEWSGTATVEGIEVGVAGKRERDRRPGDS